MNPGQIILLAYLAVLSAEDIKNKRITVGTLAAGVIPLAASVLAGNGPCFSERVTGVLLGTAVIAVAVLCRGRIGIGDGVVFTITGAFFGGGTNMLMMGVSLILAAGYGTVMLLLGRKRLKDALPFVPFIFAASLIVMVFYGREGL